VIREAADCLNDATSDCVVFVAVDDKTAAIHGAVAFKPCPLVQWKDRSLMIIALGVERRKRQQRIGTDLKRAVMAETAAQGLLFVVSEVHRANHPMMLLNKKLRVVQSDWIDADEYHFCAIRVRPSRFEPIRRLIDRFRLR
jgi:hypothetical protein